MTVATPEQHADQVLSEYGGWLHDELSDASRALAKASTLRSIVRRHLVNVALNAYADALRCATDLASSYDGEVKPSDFVAQLATKLGASYDSIRDKKKDPRLGDTESKKAKR